MATGSYKPLSYMVPVNIAATDDNHCQQILPSAAKGSTTMAYCKVGQACESYYHICSKHLDA